MFFEEKEDGIYQDISPVVQLSYIASDLTDLKSATLPGLSRSKKLSAISINLKNYFDELYAQAGNAQASSNDILVAKILGELDRLAVNKLYEISHSITDELCFVRNLPLMQEIYSRYGRNFFDIRVLKTSISLSNDPLYNSFVEAICAGKNPYLAGSFAEPNLSDENLIKSLEFIVDVEIDHALAAAGVKFNNKNSLNRFKAAILLHGLLGFEEEYSSYFYNLVLAPILNKAGSGGVPDSVNVQEINDLINHVSRLYQSAEKKDTINEAEQFIKDYWVKQAGLPFEDIDTIALINAKEQAREFIKNIIHEPAFKGKIPAVDPEEKVHKSDRVQKDIEKKISACQTFLNPKGLLQAIYSPDVIKTLKEYALDLKKEGIEVNIALINQAQILAYACSQENPNISIRNAVSSMLDASLNNLNHHQQPIVQSRNVAASPAFVFSPEETAYHSYPKPLSFKKDYKKANLKCVNFTSRDDLHNVDFSGLSLIGANFKGVNLRYANFKGADLRGADFTGADVTNVDFSGANLSEANLTGVQFASCKFQNTILIRTNLQNCSAQFGIFKEVNMTGANLENAVLSHADLTGTNLSGANLRNARLIMAQLVGTKLELADLESADLKDADLTRTDLIGANLTNASLCYAKLWRTNFAGAILLKTDVRETRFERSNANLKGTIIIGIPLVTNQHLVRTHRATNWHDNDEFELRGREDDAVKTILQLVRIIKTHKLDDGTLISFKMYEQYFKAADYLIRNNLIPKSDKKVLEQAMSSRQLFNFFLRIKPAVIASATLPVEQKNIDVTEVAGSPPLDVLDLESQKSGDIIYITDGPPSNIELATRNATSPTESANTRREEFRSISASTSASSLLHTEREGSDVSGSVYASPLLYVEEQQDNDASATSIKTLPSPHAELKVSDVNASTTTLPHHLHAEQQDSDAAPSITVPPLPLQKKGRDAIAVFAAKLPDLFKHIVSEIKEIKESPRISTQLPDSTVSKTNDETKEPEISRIAAQLPDIIVSKVEEIKDAEISRIAAQLPNTISGVEGTNEKPQTFVQRLRPAQQENKLTDSSKAYPKLSEKVFASHIASFLGRNPRCNQEENSVIRVPNRA